MERLVQDARYAFRSLRRQPGFVLTAVLTLAIGIGANAAIFNVAWHVLLKPLPYADSERLVAVWEGFGPERAINAVAPATFLDWARDARSFETLAAYNQYRSRLNLTGAGDPLELDVTHVTGEYFGVLGLSPILGRPILPSDAAAASSAVVLSERVWRGTFGADARVVGRTIRLHGEPFEVVGVMPDAASLEPDGTDAWVRLALEGERARMRQAHYLRVVGRLRRDVSVAQADADVRAITERAAEQHPLPGVAESARAIPLRDELVGSVQPGVLMLWAGAALVLLIACANVAGLQMARQAARRREAAVQSALGATRGRLFRVQAAEAILLSLPAGYAGLLLGIWVIAAIATAAPERVATAVSPTPDAVVIAYTLLLSTLAAAACALVARPPASSAAMQSWLAGRGEASAGGRGRAILVAAEVALSVLVLIGATLIVSSLLHVLRVDPGFTLERGLVVNLELPDTRYADPASRSRFYDEVTTRVEALPGVDGACAMTTAPFVPQPGSMTWVPEGQTRMVGSLPGSLTPSCLAVLGIPLLQGRAFGPVEPEPVAIVSETMARALWPDADPIGRRIHMGLPDGALHTVIGVVGDIHKTSLEIAYGRQVWLPASRQMFPPRQLVLRASVPPSGLVASVRRAIRDVDPDMPATRIETMAEVRARTLAGRRFSVLLLVAYGLAGLALCAVGVYGLLAQTVTQRTREMGIRMALGAAPHAVVRHIVVGTAGSIAVGMAAGSLAALLLLRFVQHQLFGVTPADPLAYGLVLGLVLLVGVVASWIPARRATRIDPVTALRST